MEPSVDTLVVRQIEEGLVSTCRSGKRNLKWLRENVHPYFFTTMQDETTALVNLVSGVDSISSGRRLVLVDEEKKLILAGLNEPDFFSRALLYHRRAGVSYAEITQSYHPVPGQKSHLEVQRYEFDQKALSGKENSVGEVSSRTSDAVRKSVRRHSFVT